MVAWVFVLFGALPVAVPLLLYTPLLACCPYFVVKDSLWFYHVRCPSDHLFCQSVTSELIDWYSRSLVHVRLTGLKQLLIIPAIKLVLDYSFIRWMLLKFVYDIPWVTANSNFLQSFFANVWIRIFSIFSLQIYFVSAPYTILFRFYFIRKSYIFVSSLLFGTLLRRIYWMMSKHSLETSKLYACWCWLFVQVSEYIW